MVQNRTYIAGRRSGEAGAQGEEWAYREMRVYLINQEKAIGSSDRTNTNVRERRKGNLQGTRLCARLGRQSKRRGGAGEREGTGVSKNKGGVNSYASVGGASSCTCI